MNKETRNLLVFFAATFIWTWVFYAILAVGDHNPYQMPWTICLILGGMGPSLVGVAMVLLTCTPEGRRDYWRRCFSFRRIGLPWWAIILLIFPAIYGLSVAVDVTLGGSLPGMAQLKNLIANPVSIPLAAFISFMSGPWSEEFGWRGYALDRMLKKLGVLPGSILLGLVWGVWHLPLFFMPATWHGQIGFQFTGFWSFILRNAGLALLMTWVYLNTDRSILSGMLMHFTSNFTGQLLAPSSAHYEAIAALLLLGIGLVLCARLNHAWRISYPIAEVKPT
jgi:membrane protease YdiL (CAAX protease family)